jgi:hypothetical protein
MLAVAPRLGSAQNLCHCVPILLALWGAASYNPPGCWNGIMIRIMHIISILALAAAGVIFCRCLGGAGSEEQVHATSAVERFLQNGTGKTEESDRLPPLLQEAQALALLLNPPRPPSGSAPAPKTVITAPLSAKTVSNVTPALPVTPPASAPKFELHGISYYRQKPDQSMALVLEPGGTRRWVHPGEQLGHLTIDRIDCNSVLCRDGAQTHVVALAAGEALTRYARSVKDSKPASAVKQAQEKELGPQVPPPAPGIRQMPLSRVAALLGQPS